MVTVVAPGSSARDARLLPASGRTPTHSLHTNKMMNEKTVRNVARIMLGGTLVVAGISHLTFARKSFRAQVPDWIPLPID
jgi:hypothetical protein